MPELPEVETIARGLAPGLLGREVADAATFCPTVLARQPDPAAFRRMIRGRTITATRRRAKLLLIDLSPRPDRVGDEPVHLAIHLKMTGRLFINAATPDPPRHTRLTVTLGDGQALFFQDARRFGTCRLLTGAELEAWPFYASLGPEPLDLDDAAFAALLEGRRARIKALLLDQAKIAGIGNIYADESLHAAGIRPDAPADTIGPAKRKKLLAAIKRVLTEAIAAGGSTIRDYRTAEGLEGAFQKDFKVYGRAGEPCPKCRGRLEKTTVAGRTSTFCPNCQK